MSSNIVKNFRDVGKFINKSAGNNLLSEGVLYRGGSINDVFSHDEILNIPSIISLRKGADPQIFDCNYIHIPVADKVENYETTNGKVRKWVNQVVVKVASPEVKVPILVHCTSGKDRTGVIIAAILLFLEVPVSLIIKEYLESEGANDSRLIKQSINGFGHIFDYLNKLKNPQHLKSKFIEHLG